jgi:hypothetical protein
MNFEAMMALDGLQRSMEFMREIFPWMSLLVLLFTVLGVMCVEKRKRSLLLEQSEEEGRIRAMPNLSDAEKERLLKAAAPLPESREAYPLPDVPLRLVSALAKVFGLLKIILFLGAIYSIVRILQFPEATRSVSHPGLTGLLVAGFIVLSIVQVMASMRVTRGSDMARRFLIFMAALDLNLVVWEFDLPRAVLWRLMIVAMSGCVLWVLLLRKNARASVVCDGSPPRLWQKAAVLVLCVLSCWPSVFELDLTVSANRSFHELKTFMSSGGNGGLPVERVILQAGDAGEETRALMRRIKAGLEAPVELLEFGQLPERALGGADLYLLVSQTLDVKKEKPPENASSLDPGILKLLAKNHPDMAYAFGPQRSGDREIAFEIETPFSRPPFLRPTWQTKLKWLEAADLRINLKSEYAQNDREEAVAEIAADAVQKLNAFARMRNEKAVVPVLPEVLSVEPEPLPALALECMTNCVLVTRYFCPQTEINLYRFAGGEGDVLGTVSNQLVAAGWKYDHDLRFEKKNESLVIRGPKIFADQYALPHLYLIHAQCRKIEFAEGYLDDFCRNRFAEFMELFQPKAVSAEVYRAAIEAYLEQPDLTAEQLHTVCLSTSNWKVFEEERIPVLYRLAQVLHDTPATDERISTYSFLANEMTVERIDGNPYFEKMEAVLYDRIRSVNFEPGSNGVEQVAFSVKGLERPQMIFFKKTLKDPSVSCVQLPLFLLLWIESDDEEVCRIHIYQPGGGTARGCRDIKQGYQQLRRFHDGGFWGGGAAFGHVPEITHPEKGRIMMAYTIQPETCQMDFRACLNDSAITLTRDAAGSYFLDQQALSGEELVAELKERQQSGESFGLMALLDASGRSEFEALLKAFPRRPCWIRYHDPKWMETALR